MIFWLAMDNKHFTYLFPDIFTKVSYFIIVCVWGGEGGKFASVSTKVLQESIRMGKDFEAT